jgi:hypothetical protein
MPTYLFLGMFVKRCDKRLLALVCTFVFHVEQLSPFLQIFVKLMLCRQIIAPYCENYTKHKYSVGIMQSFNVQACSAYNNHCT